MSAVTFFVPGAPATKGSTVSFADKRGRIVTKTDSPGLKLWTRDVRWMAMHARVPFAPKGVAVAVIATFQFQRPKTVSRHFPTVPPDLDKVTRALLDALTGVAYADDAQVVDLTVQKRYGDIVETKITVERKEV